MSGDSKKRSHRDKDEKKHKSKSSSSSSKHKSKKDAVDKTPAAANDAQSLAIVAQDDKEHNEQEIDVSRYVVISSLDELPADVQARLDEFEVSRDILACRLELVLHVLSFTERIPFVSPADLARLSNRTTHVLSPIVRPIDDLLSPENPKKLYRFIKREGLGGYGSVYFAKNKRTGDLVAIKRVVIKNEKSEIACRREISFLKHCDHPVIVKFYDAFRVDNEIWIAMHYLEGYDIDRACHMFQFNEEHIGFVAKQICRGLRYLHRNNILHRDLKGANVMLTIYGEVVIVDLGLMLDATVEDVTHRCGTRFWMAPEVIRQERQGPGIDIWAMAICLVEMANGRPPNWQSSIKQMFRVAWSGLGPSCGLEDATLWSDLFRDFLDQCLAVNPTNRASAEALLNHKWIETNVSDKRSQESIAKIVQVCDVQDSISVDSMF